MKYRHYAPKAKVTIISGNKEKTIEKINEIVQYYIENQKNVVILSTEENLIDILKVLIIIFRK